MSEPGAGLLDTTNPEEQTSDKKEANRSSCESKCCRKWNICFGLSIAMNVILLCSIVGVVVKHNSNTELTYAPRPLGSFGKYFGDSRDTDFLIDPRECSQFNCITRKENIKVEHIPHESRTCEENSMQSCVNSRIENSTCYYCNSTCFTKDDLIDMERIKCEECPYVEFECCLVAEILTNLTRSAAINLTNVTRLAANNLTNLIPSAGTILTNLTRSAVTNFTNLNPSAKGNYSCYKVDIHKLYNKTVVQPLLECPFGWKGERCQERNTQEFTCKCYTYKNRFPNQDQMPECNKKPKCKTERISKCFMSKKIDGIQRKCLCTNEKVEEAINKDSSENHHT